jgi:hypothetical protein
MTSPLEGLRFPSVAGVALSGAPVRIPEDLVGAPALLLCAYRRGAQADIDRWAAFAGHELPQLAVFELPIIPAVIWRPCRAGSTAACVAASLARSGPAW